MSYDFIITCMVAGLCVILIVVLIAMENMLEKSIEEERRLYRRLINELRPSTIPEDAEHRKLSNSRHVSMAAKQTDAMIYKAGDDE